MYYDMTELSWKDTESGRLYRITDFCDVDDITVVWYKDRGTGEVHCMDANMFTIKHESMGQLALERNTID